MRSFPVVAPNSTVIFIGLAFSRILHAGSNAFLTAPGNSAGTSTSGGHCATPEPDRMAHLA
ncbi:hypothetical protein BQ8482_170115 [Mesorhizobium delmotii]|uniref:Uncharacterized protein n=1 Tax=Mesorhizobium delmotii TaxID=1631247 RepID=A0A2P9AI04_9HYPH|nr:hypothetical protein BQ8482_170115 [Mesorhizobium delmotii]